MSASEIPTSTSNGARETTQINRKMISEEENIEAATALIKEFGLIIQKPSEVSKFSLHLQPLSSLFNIKKSVADAKPVPDVF